MTDSPIRAYAKIHNLGSSDVAGIFYDDQPVTVQEKVDGSQISFGLMPRFGDGPEKDLDHYKLHVRSKGRPIDLENPGMFEAAVTAIQATDLILEPGWVYRGEYLSKPKHNKLAYDRVPRNHIALFDVCTEGGHLCHQRVAAEAERLLFDAVPTFFQRSVSTVNELTELFERESFLGGVKIEGVVIKRYDLTTRFHEPMFAKYVSPAFQEVMQTKKRKPPKTGIDFINDLVAKYGTERRWEKAVERLRDAGELVGSPRDIGPLIKSVMSDIEEECADEIKEALYGYFWYGQIRKGVVHDLPEWYKARLVEAFDSDKPQAIEEA